MSLRAVAGILGGTILLAVFISWLDNRIDRRVEQGIESAVRAIRPVSTRGDQPHPRCHRRRNRPRAAGLRCP